MQLTRYPVHRALTRPQMFAGVTMNFFIINMMVSTIAFLILKSWWFVPIALAMHTVGYLASLREPRIFDLWITKVSTCPRVKNYSRWGCNSYAA
ncbi:type IV secretion system protein VirB3 [Aurantiacibacter gangjinensis]|uniref:Type VI secretion protein n=1 Tax=Aurantiacibacter gangjinensis TaxID=502682 RepID=A0A0G9MR90_9SPHN|nr:VirB3 family type IV secretion system protein [Aurantiacibacter gangjinensis]APE27854.1 Inner membrane protein forms channel for type IV secretion of T-DNA complex, VirB3 [Aurantiacibacter gangjinensis]KLE31828.1 type VI secretion protein [Aurantiacibacter gangjinensis]